MKRLLLALGVTGLAVTARAESEFLRDITPEEYTAAGLHKQTPDELAKLVTLVQRFKSSELALVRQEAATRLAAAETKAAAGQPADKNKPGWLKSLLSASPGGDAPPPEAMESHIVGELEGWDFRTVFRLENGQIWKPAGSDNYSHWRTLKSPKVRIYPAKLGGYWMEIEDVAQPVAVTPLKLK
ncbi:MAG: hypothetical protein ACREB3_03510 [Burkholderiales bacterium]